VPVNGTSADPGEYVLGLVGQLETLLGHELDAETAAEVQGLFVDAYLDGLDAALVEAEAR
jgi:hypothetical protein